MYGGTLFLFIMCVTTGKRLKKNREAAVEVALFGLQQIPCLRRLEPVERSISEL